MVHWDGLLGGQAFSRVVISCLDARTVAAFGRISKSCAAIASSAIRDIRWSLFVIGGDEAEDEGWKINVVGRYSVDDQTWEQLAALPHECRHASVIALEGQIYVSGVYAHDRHMFVRFDQVRQKWEELGSCPIVPRHEYQQPAVVLDGKAYVVGADGNRQRVVRYGSHSSWELLPLVPIEAEHMRILTAGGAIYAISSDHHQVAFSKYVPSVGAWELLDMPRIERLESALSTWLHGYATADVATVGSNIVVSCIDGHQADMAQQARATMHGYSVSHHLWYYCCSRSTWTQGQPMPTPRRFGHMVSMEGVTYFIGGDRHDPSLPREEKSQVVEGFKISEHFGCQFGRWRICVPTNFVCHELVIALPDGTALIALGGHEEFEDFDDYRPEPGDLMECLTASSRCTSLGRHEQVFGLGGSWEDCGLLPEALRMQLVSGACVSSLAHHSD